MFVLLDCEVVVIYVFSSFAILLVGFVVLVFCILIFVALVWATVLQALGCGFTLCLGLGFDLGVWICAAGFVDFGCVFRCGLVGFAWVWVLVLVFLGLMRLLLLCFMVVCVGSRCLFCVGYCW